ncbi:MAG: hypothetical protein KKF80_03160, partial [Candidatus Omnitrophica bacterium]|nr:hypothetical protein [Candidatus Omnitrophota bacterium]
PNTLAGRLSFAYTSRKSQRYFHDRLQDAIGVTIMGGRARAAAEISKPKATQQGVLLDYGNFGKRRGIPEKC